MKPIKSQYSFQDWKNGSIPKPSFTNKEINKLPSDIRATVVLWKSVGLDWPVLWRLLGLIDSETRSKIEKEKRRAFLIGAEVSAESKFRKFKEFIDEVAEGNRESMVDLEVQKAENWFMNETLKQRVIAGHVNESSISPKLYDLFISDEKRLSEKSNYKTSIIPQVRHETVDGFKFVDFEDHLFYAHANYRYLEKIKVFRKLKFITDREVKEECNSAPEGVKAGKIAFVLYIRDKHNLNSETAAYEKAVKMFPDWMYTTKDSFDVSKTKTDMEKVYKILNRVK